MCIEALFIAFFLGFHPFFRQLALYACIYGDTYFLVPFNVLVSERVVVRSKGCVKLLPYHTHKHGNMKTMLTWLFSGHQTKRLAKQANVVGCVCAFLHYIRISFSKKSNFMPNISHSTLQKCFVLFLRMECENGFRADN